MAQNGFQETMLPLFPVAGDEDEAMGVALPAKLPSYISDHRKRLRDRFLELAADCATRSAAHDHDASHPPENYDILRREVCLSLTVPRQSGGQGVSFLAHTLHYEARSRGSPCTPFADTIDVPGGKPR